MKGIELPITILVSFMIIIIVGISLITLLRNSTDTGGGAILCKQDFQTACNSYIVAGGCQDNTVPIEKYITGEVMDCGIGSVNKEEAKKICCVN